MNLSTQRRNPCLGDLPLDLQENPTRSLLSGKGIQQIYRVSELIKKAKREYYHDPHSICPGFESILALRKAKIEIEVCYVEKIPQSAPSRMV